MVNRFHSSILLISVVKQNKVQIFVATHSDELISAFGRVARQLDFDDMCLINMSAAAERNHVRVFERDDMDYARELNADLRS